MAEKIKTSSEVVGAVKGVKFYDPETKTIIAVLDNKVTVKGEIDEPTTDFPAWIVGKRMRWLGFWAEHVRYGEQFEFATYLEDRPLGRKAVVNWVTRNCDGIGPVKANALVDQYGDDTIHILTHRPEQTVDDGILDHALAYTASSGLQAEDGLCRTKVELFGMLAGHGFPRKAVQKCIEKWGAKAADIIRRNPFAPMVARISGFGFKRCDSFYLSLNLPKNKLNRQMLAAWYAIANDSDGNTWHSAVIVKRAILSAVGNKDDMQVEKALTLGLRAGWLAERTDDDGSRWIAQAAKAQDELTLARLVQRFLLQDATYWPVVDDPQLSDHQKEKLAVATTKPLGILAGTPGTGKTFTVAKLIKALRDDHCRVAACAPTGKAAVRLTENLAANGVPIEATTIHRLLKVGGDRDADGNYVFEHNEKKPLTHDYIFVDEVSMTDTTLLCSLFRAIKPTAHVLLIGDPYQLPPVGHGAPLRDCLRAGVPCGELDEIRRNAGMIVEACAQIKNGKKFDTAESVDEDNGQNLRFIHAESPEVAQDLIKKILLRFRDNGRYDPVWDCQVLVAVNEKSALSRTVINPILQSVINPIRSDQESVSIRSVTGFRTRDKVICLKNSMLIGFELEKGKALDDPDGYEAATVPTGDRWSKQAPVSHFVANGELGKVLAVSDTDAVLEFPPDRVVKVFLGPNSPYKNTFDLGYAITTHKSQGSEWPCVIVVGDKNGGQVTCREHLYTAISRGKRLTLLVGDMNTFWRQIRKVTLASRKTFLTELIQREVDDQ